MVWHLQSGLADGWQVSGVLARRAYVYIWIHWLTYPIECDECLRVMSVFPLGRAAVMLFIHHDVHDALCHCFTWQPHFEAVDEKAQHVGELQILVCMSYNHDCCMVPLL